MTERHRAIKSILGVAQQAIALLVASQLAVGSLPVYAATPGANDGNTVTPIKHVIIIIGENRTFDHVFATYSPRNWDQSVDNLLSKKIIKADGTPGKNYAAAMQYNPVTTSTFQLAPTTAKAAYPTLPPPIAGGHQFASDATGEPFATEAVAEVNEPNLEASYDPFLISGATGLVSGKVADSRIPNVENLPAGPFQLTPGVAYDDYAASPVHRFYQMWQQSDCDITKANAANPSGCQMDLFPWVETTIGAGSNGNAQPAGFNNITTGEGSTSMAFYNMQQGDAPYFKSLADTFTISDNFHQSVMGGTGANHIMFGFGDAIWYEGGQGAPQAPPLNEVENPNPQAGTNNYYDQDGYSGGSYTNCSELTQPGVAAIVNYLESLPTPVKSNCQPGHYYLLNNYNPGYVGDGLTVKAAAAAYVATFPPAEQPIVAAELAPTVAFTVTPTTVPHIGDVLESNKVSYTYYGEGWDSYVTDPLEQRLNDRYCTICNPFQYATDVMTSGAERKAHISDIPELMTAIKTNTLPAVSIVKPSGFTDGHPGSSKLDLFEGFTKNIVDALIANTNDLHDTAVFITFDEGGGYYDSGYVQPVDYFGDGTRIPLIIVSAYTIGGYVNHSYGDHVSLDKFIERNWSLPKISSRSRDNLPNPIPSVSNPMAPSNGPALDDLFDAFHFPAAK